MQPEMNSAGQPTSSLRSRRRFLTRLGLGAAALSASGLFAPGALAEELTRTPPQTEGPFYPDKLPLDTDNDLLIVNDTITPAVGEVTHLGGRILDAKGNPVRSALVEIWQCDHDGSYVHTRGANPETSKRDRNFQGFGRFMTGTRGEYYFRTIKPVPYPGRTPHIHFKVKMKGHDELTTQCYIRGEARNERDGVFRGIREGKARESVLVDFKPMKESRIGELAATFDIVLGSTPSL